MVLYERNKIGNLSQVRLESGKTYLIEFDIKTNKVYNINKEVNIGKKIQIVKLRPLPNGNTELEIRIPKENPVFIPVIIYGLTTILAGFGIYIGTKNIVKISEKIFNPISLIAILLAIYFIRK